ncbi:MAG: hypothetical protein MUF18_21985 [Fimbriiglobus sp.]|nr:hypothetical protein [Fimbriiglobus sp.]
MCKVIIILLNYQIKLLFFVLYFLFSHKLSAQDRSSQVESIRQTWLSLGTAEHCSSYRLSIHLYRAAPGGELRLDEEKETIYHDSHEGFSLDNMQTRLAEGKAGRREREILLVNRIYACKLRQDPKSGELVLLNPPNMHPVGEERPRIADAQQSNRLLWLKPSRTFRLHDLIDPALSRIVAVESAGPDLVRVTFRIRSGLSEQDQQKVGGVSAGSLVLNSRWHHRLEKADIEFSPQTHHRQTYRITYIDQPGKEHHMKSLESEAKWQLEGDPSPRIGKMIVGYEELPPTDDPRIFYLSHYGLPEPEGVTAPPKSFPLWVWLLSAAGVFATVAVFCGWIARRRRRACTKGTPSAG